MNKKIKIAKFIHKFEVDLEYRNNLSEKHENKKIRKLANYIACNSIDWVYFSISEKSNYNELYKKHIK